MELPTAFINKYQQLLGNEAAIFFTALTEGSYQKAFRVNPLKPAEKEMVSAFGFADAPVAPYASDGFLGKVSGKSPLHQAGYVYSQEPSAMLVATVVAAQPGEKVLDLCAAPGGKSTQLLSQLNNQELLVSNEIFNKRAKILGENVERWGAKNNIVTNHAPAELVTSFRGFFDKILVDAPCSGEGMFRKDEVAIQEWTAESSEICAARQKEILTAALQMLKTEGTLVYSTCTFAPEENEEIVSWLIENYPVSIAEINVPETENGRPKWGSVAGLEKTARIWPHLNIGEGHFVAKLIFHGENPQPASKKEKRKSKAPTNQVNLSKEETQLVRSFLADFPLEQAGEWIKFGEQVWQLPAEISFSQIAQLKLVRPGLHLGTMKKNRFEPSFALAMASGSKEWPQLQITEAEWQHYVAGETFQNTGNAGWVLLLLDKIPVGFGKQVQGTVKNFYPKGLRFQIL